MFKLRRLLPTLVGMAAIALFSASDPALAQSSAEYIVVFNSTWSAETHPLNFPTGPHYSGLIGGTHNSGLALWELGELASEGMEDMAEQGSKMRLQFQVNDAINAGTAEFLLSGGGINNSPGSVELSFEISEDFSLVSLVSMLAPSPDWWVGVGGLDLHPAGDWLDDLVVDLVVYDAGTDSGVNYMSPNMDTNPAEPISIKVDGPFADNNIVGTFTFSRQVSSVDDLATAGPRLLLPLSANPLRDVARFQISPALFNTTSDNPTMDLNIFDARGARIRTLARGVDIRSMSVAEWDGRNSRGDLMPAGTYFLSLHAGQVQQTARIVIVR